MSQSATAERHSARTSISNTEGSASKPIIIYAVNGQGRGHAAKSLALYEELCADYDVRFFAGGEAHDFFTKKGLAVVEIPSLRFRFKNSAIYLRGTVVHNLPLLRRFFSVIKDIRRKIDALQPALVISDFETFVPRAARKLGVPVLQISHQIVITDGKIPVPLAQRISWWKAWLVSNLIISRFTSAIGVSFFDVPLQARRRKRVVIKPPILRKDMMLAREQGKTGGGDHILAYFSCPEFAWVSERLAQHPEHKFIVYGPDPKTQTPHSNITYKKISPDEFLADLISARAIVTNGGHNFIAEAHFLGIPVLSFWVKGQFEQYLNAWYVDHMKIGRMVRHLGETDQVMGEFLTELNDGVFKPVSLPEAGNQTIAGFIREMTGVAVKSPLSGCQGEGNFPVRHC